MGYQIYPNCIGTYVFNDKKIVDEMLFAGNEFVECNKALQKNDELKTEKEMFNNYPGSEFLGNKIVPPIWCLQ
jgi:hypothetical protein